MAGVHIHAHGLAPEEASRITRRVALYAIVVASGLAALKLWAWLASGSVAMLAAAFDSGLDALASLATFAVVRYAATPPDAEHRFGHGKAEAFAGLFHGGVVAVSAIGLAVASVQRLSAPQALAQEPLSLAVMTVSILATAGLIAAQSRALRQTGSAATAGDRAHYASDLAANAVVILGVGAAWLFGAYWADGAAGLAIAVWLGWAAVQVAQTSAAHLLDRELADADRERIRALALEDERILDVHDLRTRASGPFMHVQFHADLEPTLSLVEAHRIVVAAEERIRAAYPAADVIIHPDPRGRAEPHGHDFFAKVDRHDG